VNRRATTQPVGSRQALALVALALATLGCSIVGEPVELAVRTDPFTPGCHTFSTSGMLIPHAESGTAIVEDGVAGGRTLPVLWPDGFAARRVLGVIEVLDQDGRVIARTGQSYVFAGGYGENGWRGCETVTAR
jgi:hypothetical protein